MEEKRIGGRTGWKKEEERSKRGRKEREERGSSKTI